MRGHAFRSPLLYWLITPLKLALICLCLVGLLGTTPAIAATAGIVLPSFQPSPLYLAQAASIEELRQQQEQIDKQRSQVSKERDRLQNLERSAQGQLSGLKSTIRATAAQIKANEARLEQATQQLRQLQKILKGAEQTYQKKQNATVARLRFLQRQQGSRGWAVLLQSKNLNEFLDRRYHLKQVYQADRQVLSELKTQADRIEQQQNRVEQKKNEIAILTQQLLAQKADSEAQATLQVDLIDRLRSDRRALEAAESQLEQDSRNVGVLIQRRVAEQRGRDRIAYRGTGQMIYPNDGVITSGFGWRVHPILGYERFHAGIDFGGDYGSTIIAADSGVVIFSGWYGGYGNAVIIDHGNGITSLYGHASELFVAEGQAVRQGDAIAAIGSTGLSTGPHLHFEVRQNGEPVDPATYL